MDWLLFIILGSVFLFGIGIGIGFIFGIAATLAVQQMTM